MPWALWRSADKRQHINGGQSAVTLVAREHYLHIGDHPNSMPGITCQPSSAMFARETLRAARVESIVRLLEVPTRSQQVPCLPPQDLLTTGGGVRSRRTYAGQRKLRLKEEE